MDMSRSARRPRLEDVAERVGMSPASVSMVLSNAPGPSAATRERVLEAAAELGYRPDRTASLLARRRTHLVGVLMELGSAFHAELAADLHEAADRRRGYRTAMRRHRLGGHLQVIGGDHTEAAGTRAAQALLEAGRPLPTAVVAFNDHCALGLLDAFSRAGVGVPADVSVVGYDDSSLSRLAHVNLTTVSQDARRQAEHAVAAAVGRLDHGRSAAGEVVLAPHLVVRGTTGPPPPGAVAEARAGTA
jgi:DNA-binding LacI/PurR family transcriptional regulator